MTEESASSHGVKVFKVAFHLQEERPNWPPVSVERLWGEKTRVKFKMRLVNTPFFARGVAYGDVVHVRPDHEQQEYVFEEFTAESGHSTIRIVLTKPEVRDDVESAILSAGCSWEGLDDFPSLLAVDVPAEVDYAPFRQWLVAKFASGDIEFQESAISSTHRESIIDSPS